MLRITRHWCVMQSEPIMVDISSEKESPVGLVTVKEEVASMQIGSSSVPKKKRKGQKSSSSAPKKNHTRTSARVEEEVVQMGPSSSGVVESAACVGVSSDDIPGYIPPYWPGVQPKNLTKNQKYQVNMPAIP